MPDEALRERRVKVMSGPHRGRIGVVTSVSRGVSTSTEDPCAQIVYVKFDNDGEGAGVWEWRLLLIE